MLSKLLSLFVPARPPAKRAPVRRRAGHEDPGPTTLLQLCEAETDWNQWRTPERDHDRVLSTAARMWLKSLPDELRPYDLASCHPRVVNRVALCWNDPTLTDRLFDELLVDRRGDRKGFAPGVAEDLMRLRMYHEKVFEHDAGSQTWQLQTVAAGDRDSAFGRLAAPSR